jgi:chorismate-pyruvate lyase
MTHLIDEPGLFDTLDAWEQHLTDLLSLPDSVSRRLSVQQAKAVIAKMRAAET